MNALPKGYEAAARAYDNAAPEDEDYFTAREARREAQAERRLDAAMCADPMEHARPVTVHGLVWCPVTKRAVPDGGRKVYPEDYIA